MKILLIGSGGQLGQDTLRIVPPQHEVCAVDIDELDITDESAEWAVS